MICVALSAVIILMLQNFKTGNMVIGVLSLLIAILAIALIIEAVWLSNSARPKLYPVKMIPPNRLPVDILSCRMLKYSLTSR